MIKNIYIIAAVLLVLGLAAWVFIIAWPKPAVDKIFPANTISQVDYLCDGGKTINAKYYQGPKAPQVQPGEMPTPTGSVELILSDGRQLTLLQTISASGIRYATSNETIIFWSKGNGAFITENDIQTYLGCIALAKDSGTLPQVYASSTAGFSIRYPAGYIIMDKDINGIKFIIPVEMATGTNLSSYDTGVSVEITSSIQNCNVGLATSSDAGAGNFYDQMVWEIQGVNSCVAVRYFIHSTNIANYSEGAVIEFNRENLINQFDAIRKSLILSP